MALHNESEGHTYVLSLKVRVIDIEPETLRSGDRLRQLLQLSHFVLRCVFDVV